MKYAQRELLFSPFMSYSIHLNLKWKLRKNKTCSTLIHFYSFWVLWIYSFISVLFLSLKCFEIKKSSFKLKIWIWEKSRNKKNGFSVILRWDSIRYLNLIGFGLKWIHSSGLIHFMFGERWPEIHMAPFRVLRWWFGSLENNDFQCWTHGRACSWLEGMVMGLIIFVV